MQGQTPLPIQHVAATKSITMTPHIPIRVFLLSDHRLLRDALARALKGQADISLVGTQESSLNTVADIIASTCDVLLVDPVNRSTLNPEFPDHLQDALSNLRIIMIDMEAKIADVISAILSASPTHQASGDAEV